MNIESTMPEISGFDQIYCSCMKNTFYFIQYQHHFFITNLQLQIFIWKIILDRPKKCDKSYSCFEVWKIAPLMCYCQSLKVYNKHNSLLLNFLPFSNYSCRDISLKIVYIKPCITVSFWYFSTPNKAFLTTHKMWLE